MIETLALDALKRIGADDLPEAMLALGERVGEVRLRDWLSSSAGYNPNDPVDVLRALRGRVGTAGIRRALAQTTATDAPVTEDFWRHTEIGNAERLIERFGCDLRHCPETESWYVWDGKRWRCGPDVYGVVVGHMKATIRQTAELAKTLSKDAEQAVFAKNLGEWTTRSESNGRITASLKLAESETGVAVLTEQMDSQPWLLNCENGTLNLRTGELSAHRREDLITRLTTGVHYNPDAICPTWTAALEKWQPDEEVRSFLQRWAGYCLTGATGEETCAFLWGSGRNGKSKFTGALESILGDYAARISIDVLMDARRAGAATPDLIPLIGARVIFASEISEGKRLNEAFIKDLTGGDKLTARPLYGSTIQFRPQFKPMLAGNHKPYIRTTDEGFWARFPLVPFSVFIPKEERDPALAEKLLAERDGILAWAVRGCMEWQKRRLDPPAAVIEASEEYRRDQDAFAGFWDATCTFSVRAWAKSADIREAFRAWSGETDDKRLPSANQFAERLKNLGCVQEVKKIEGKACRVWMGVGLQSERTAETSEGLAGYWENPNETDAPVRPVTPVTPVTPEIQTTVTRVRAGAEYSSIYDVTDVTGVTIEIEDEGVEL